MHATLEGPWVRLFPITRGISSLFLLVHVGCASFGLPLAFPFVSSLMVLAIDFLLDFCVALFSIQEGSFFKFVLKHGGAMNKWA
jgi:hypothetical protein